MSEVSLGVRCRFILRSWGNWYTRTLFCLCILILSAGILPASAQSTYTIADSLNLLPTPRSISLDGAVHDLPQWEIVVPAEHEFLRAGATEINDRIRSLGGPPLPVVRRPQPNRSSIVIGRWWDPGVRSLAMELDVTLTASDPGAQGYVIEFGEQSGSKVVLLGGSDAQGALYGAVTFRRLIQVRPNGLVAIRASVRDWPDYNKRGIGQLNLNHIRAVDASLAKLEPIDAAKEALKNRIDFFLRHKINHVYGSFFFRSEGTDPELFEYQREAAIDVLEYAERRGIDVRILGGVEVGKYLSPQQRKIALERGPGTAYMWSAFDAHRKQAQKYADFIRDAKADIFSLHVYDGGAYPDPENWSQRSPPDRKMYGDDRPRASLEQFKIYFNTVRDAVPRVELEMVAYPYFFQFARDGFTEHYGEWNQGLSKGWYGNVETADQARRIKDQLTTYHHHLAAHMPDDTYIVFRESSRPVFEACARIYQGHPITIWYDVDRDDGWKGTFTPQMRMAPTFWRPDYEDYFFLGSGWTRSDTRVHLLTLQEYLWQTDRPDAQADFTHFNRFYLRGGRDITSFQEEHLIPRIANILYGGRAQAFETVIRSNLSLHYVADPEETTSGYPSSEEYFDSTYQFMGEQADKFDRVASTFSQLIDDTDKRAFDRQVQAWTIYWYRYAHQAAARADLLDLRHRADSLQQSGAPDQAALVARKALERLNELDHRMQTIRDRSDELWRNAYQQLGFAPAYKHSSLKPLDELDIAAFRDDFQHILDTDE